DSEEETRREPYERYPIRERLLQLEVADVDGPRRRLAAVFPIAPELQKGPEPRAYVQVGVREEARLVGGEARAAREAEERRLRVFDALAGLPAHRQEGRAALVERDELEPLEERRLRPVAQEAVVLPPANDVELVADRALLFPEHALAAQGGQK